MDRRKFLKVTGAVAAAVVPATGAVAAEEIRIAKSMWSGHAVGIHRPPHITATALVWRAQTSQRLAAITFDDGPSAECTPKVLSVLEQTDTPATFFMIGKHAEENPDLVRRVGERHAVGNHTYTHPDMSQATAEVATRELGRTHDVIEKILGRAPFAFRAPYGRVSGALAMVAAGMGYDMLFWSDLLEAADTPASNLSRLGPAVGPGSIVLAHDGGKMGNETVVRTLPGLIRRIRERGFTLVTVPDLLVAMRLEQAKKVSGPQNSHVAATKTSD